MASPALPLHDPGEPPPPPPSSSLPGAVALRWPRFLLAEQHPRVQLSAHPAQGDFASQGGALKAAEAGREILRREIEQAETARCGILQLTPQVLERRLEALVEKLRSGATGLVREAIRASVEKILVREDGALTLEVKPEGLLGTQTAIATSGCRETGPMLERVIQAGTGGQWKVYGAG